MPEPPSMWQSILLGWISLLIGRAYSKQEAQGLPTWLFLLTPVPILRPMCAFSDALSWSTLCDPMDCSLPGSSVHGILQARILEWVAISSSGASYWPKDWTHISCFAGGFFYHWVTWEALWDLYLTAYLRTSLVAQRFKRLPRMQETRVRSLGWEDPLEKEMATHFSTLAWRIPWREEPGRLQPMGSQRVRHDWATSLHSLWGLYLAPYSHSWSLGTHALSDNHSHACLK